MDIVESEFFAAALFELCTATFNSTVNTYLADQLNTTIMTRKTSSEHLTVPLLLEEPRIPVVQLTTVLY